MSGPTAFGPRPSGQALDGAEPETGGWQRLAWGMLLVQPIRELLRFVPLLLVLLFVGRSDGASRPPWEFIAAGLVILYGVGRFVSTRWRITPTAVEVRHGVIGRRLLTAPRERIRSIDISAHPLQRMLGLVKLHIGTGTSGPRSRGVELDGLPRAAAERLRAELLHTAGAGAGSADPPRPGSGRADQDPAARATEPPRVLAAFRPGWIAYGPATLSGVVTAAAVLALGLRLLSEAQVRPTSIGPVATVLRHLAAAPWWVVGLQVIAVVLVVTTLLSLAGYVLSYWGFRLVRHRTGEIGPATDRGADDSALQTSRGLVSTRSTTIAEHRLHGVERVEPLLLRAVGGARLVAVATGLREGREAGRGGDLLVPPAPRATVLDVERAVLPWSGPLDHATAPLLPRGPAARRRRFTRALLGVAVAAAVALVLWWRGLVPGWVPITAAALVVPAAGVAQDRFVALGHTLLRSGNRPGGGDLLVSRLGSLIRRRVTLRRRGAVGVVLRSSPFQRRSGLVTLTVTTAAGSQHYDLPDLDGAVAVGLAADLVPAVRQFRTADRPGPGSGGAATSAPGPTTPRARGDVPTPDREHG